MHFSLHNTVLLIAAGILVGVTAGLGCARQDESFPADDEAAVEPQKDEFRHKKDQHGKPWLQVAGAPPTRLHYCLFFGSWGGVIGVLLAAGGNWVIALPAGVFGGMSGLCIERAANGLMFDRGFIRAHDPKVALIMFIAFLSATVAAFYSSLQDKKPQKKQLREPD